MSQSKSLKAGIIKTGTPSILAGNEMSYGIIRENREIADTSVGPAKRHVEVELPRGTTYQTGDYLVVLPLNPQPLVDRVLKRFDLHTDDLIQLQGTNKVYLLLDAPKTVYEFFATRVDLNNVATQRQLKVLAAAATDSEERARLEYFGASKEQYHREILEKRASVIDVLEDHPSCRLDLAEYIDMLKPLAPRQYSISSSPLYSNSLGSSANPEVSLSASLYHHVGLPGHDLDFITRLTHF